MFFNRSKSEKNIEASRSRFLNPDLINFANIEIFSSGWNRPFKAEMKVIGSNLALLSVFPSKFQRRKQIIYFTLGLCEKVKFDDNRRAHGELRWIQYAMIIQDTYT